MKITGFETIPIQVRAMILKMFTDEGLVGYGEPMNYEHWRVVAQVIEDMAEYLVGKDPLTIEDHWQAMYRSSYSRSMPVLVGALSGIEMAMCLAKWAAGLETFGWKSSQSHSRVHRYGRDDVRRMRGDGDL